jgi:quaternary ammonium compound-resistance protein SugE
MCVSRAAGTAIIGMAFFGESPNAGRVCSLVLILIGVIGLKLQRDGLKKEVRG